MLDVLRVLHVTTEMFHLRCLGADLLSQKVLVSLRSAGDPAPSDRAADPFISSGHPPQRSAAHGTRGLPGFLQEHQSSTGEERRMELLGAAVAFRLLLVSWLATGPALARVRHPLPVLWMMPLGSGAGGGNRTAGIVSAVRLALQDLEKQPAPLGSYQIQLQPLDCPVGPDPDGGSRKYSFRARTDFNHRDSSRKLSGNSPNGCFFFQYKILMFVTSCF